jgi:sugar lactone lactonase YvrE
MKSIFMQKGERVEMETNRPPLKRLALVISALVLCTVDLHAQSAPTITTQPASQTNLAGTSVSFSVGAGGASPFSYRWQFNGSNLPNNIITTVAGNGNNFYSGDGGAATNTALYVPCGVAFDAAGNLYIADTLNGRIRKVGNNGIITTVAGGGAGGDGGPATNASLAFPGFIVLDTSGNLYIDDNSNQRIRNVDTNGIITTVAGNGVLGYSGDGGPATNASLHLAPGAPCGVALDAVGNLYIGDAGNNRIRKVDTKGIITTIAGNGSSGYSGDGGTATNASLSSPSGVVFDPAGSLYIADQANNRVRKVDTNGIITTVAGNGSATFAGDGGAATNASLYAPSGLASDGAGNLYISDEFNNRIRNLDNNGIITTVAGNGSEAYGGDGGAAVSASLFQPIGLCFDAAGNLYIADEGNNRIRKLWLYPTYPTLRLLNVGATDAGNYAVVVTNSYGSVTSAVAALTVLLPPSILVQPASQGVLIGSNATLSVVATGTPPLFYSWFFGATNLVQAGTNALFAVTNMSATNGGPYTVVVSNAYGGVTSQIATLTAEHSPLISAQPASLDSHAAVAP